MSVIPHTHSVKALDWIPSEKEFVQLLDDNLFVDYFNVFNSLPIFAQHVLYKIENNEFEYDPPIPDYCVPHGGGLLKWLVNHRLAFFVKSDVYLEYLLCRKLCDKHLNTSSTTTGASANTRQDSPATISSQNESNNATDTSQRRGRPKTSLPDSVQSSTSESASSSASTYRSDVTVSSGSSGSSSFVRHSPSSSSSAIFAKPLSQHNPLNSNFRDHALSHVFGMRQFRHFLSKTKGQTSLMFWLRVEKLLRMPDSEEKWDHFREIQLVYLNGKVKWNRTKFSDAVRGSSTFLNEPASTTLGIPTVPVDSTVNDILLDLQDITIDVLKTYWIPRFLSKHGARVAYEESNSLHFGELKGILNIFSRITKYSSFAIVSNIEEIRNALPRMSDEQKIQSLPKPVKRRISNQEKMGVDSSILADQVSSFYSTDVSFVESKKTLSTIVLTPEISGDGPDEKNAGDARKRTGSPLTSPPNKGSRLAPQSFADHNVRTPGHFSDMTVVVERDPIRIPKFSDEFKRAHKLMEELQLSLRVVPSPIPKTSLSNVKHKDLPYNDCKTVDNHFKQYWDGPKLESNVVGRTEVIEKVAEFRLKQKLFRQSICADLFAGGPLTNFVSKGDVKPILGNYLSFSQDLISYIATSYWITDDGVCSQILLRRGLRIVGKYLLNETHKMHIAMPQRTSTLLTSILKTVTPSDEETLLLKLAQDMVCQPLRKTWKNYLLFDKQMFRVLVILNLKCSIGFTTSLAKSNHSDGSQDKPDSKLLSISHIQVEETAWWSKIKSKSKMAFLQAIAEVSNVNFANDATLSQSSPLTDSPLESTNTVTSKSPSKSSKTTLPSFTDDSYKNVIAVNAERTILAWHLAADMATVGHDDFEVEALEDYSKAMMGDTCTKRVKVTQNYSMRHLIRPSKLRVADIRFKPMKPDSVASTESTTMNSLFGSKFELTEDKMDFNHHLSHPRNMAEVLRDPDHLKQFKLFLEMYNAQLPLAFYLVIEDFKFRCLSGNKNSRQKQLMITAILKRFFSPKHDYGAGLDCDAKIIKEIPRLPAVSPAILYNAQMCVARSLEDKWFKKYAAMFGYGSGDFGEFLAERRGWNPDSSIQSLWTYIIRCLVHFMRGIEDMKTRKSFCRYVTRVLPQQIPPVDKEKQKLTLEHLPASAISKTDPGEPLRLLFGRLVCMHKLPNDIDFLFECIKYSQLASKCLKDAREGFYSKNHIKMLTRKADAIVKLYLRTEAAVKLQVNLPHDLWEQILLDYDSQQFDKRLFTRAISQMAPFIYRIYKKFCKSFYVPSSLVPLPMVTPESKHHIYHCDAASEQRLETSKKYTNLVAGDCSRVPYLHTQVHMMDEGFHKSKYHRYFFSVHGGWRHIVPVSHREHLDPYIFDPVSDTFLSVDFVPIVKNPSKKTVGYCSKKTQGAICSHATNHQHAEGNKDSPHPEIKGSTSLHISAHGSSQQSTHHFGIQSHGHALSKTHLSSSKMQVPVVSSGMNSTGSRTVDGPIGGSVTRAHARHTN